MFSDRALEWAVTDAPSEFHVRMEWMGATYVNFSGGIVVGFSAVPEPSSAVLYLSLALGLALGLTLRRGRRS